MTDDEIKLAVATARANNIDVKTAYVPEPDGTRVVLTCAGPIGVVYEPYLAKGVALLESRHGGLIRVEYGAEPETQRSIKRCTCGGEKSGCGTHSDWCDSL